MKIGWKLRMTAAQRGVWTGAQLRRLLVDKAGLEMSSASVSALFTRATQSDQAVHFDRVVHRAGVHPQRLVRHRHHPVGTAGGPGGQSGRSSTTGLGPGQVDAAPVTWSS